MAAVTTTASKDMAHGVRHCPKHFTDRSTWELPDDPQASSIRNTVQWLKGSVARARAQNQRLCDPRA